MKGERGERGEEKEVQEERGCNKSRERGIMGKK